VPQVGQTYRPSVQSWTIAHAIRSAVMLTSSISALQTEVAPRVADHRLRLDDAVEVRGRDAQRQCRVTQAGALAIGLVGDRGRLVVADRRAQRGDEHQREPDVA